MARRKTEENPLECKFCKKEFKSELTLIKHACSKKLRWLDKDTKSSQIAYHAYTRFYQTSTSMGTPTFEKFIGSQYYTGFVKFANHVIALGLKYPEEFIDYVIKSTVPLDKWCNNAVYEQFILLRQNREHWETGIERTILTMTEWATRNDKSWTDFFDINPNELTHLIRQGKVSPWWIYTSEKAKTIIAKMNEDQLLLVHKFIDSQVWKRRMISEKTETAKLRQFILEHDL